MRSKNEKKNELVNAILEAYQPETAEDVQNALKDIFGPMFEAMLQGEMNNLFISMDGVSGLEDWAKEIFKGVVGWSLIIFIIYLDNLHIFLTYPQII